MAVDLSDYVPSLLRQVNAPGATTYAATALDTMVGHLVDAFWEARLEGFLGGFSCDEDGFVTSTSATPIDPGPDLPRQGVALIVIYAGIKVLRNRILNTQTLFRAKAGPVEIEQQNSATMLAEMLKQLAATKMAIVSRSDVEATVVGVYDVVAERLSLRQLGA